jgi:uncharacterized protein YprB with RNaseH-like and TPR domain
MIRRTFIHLPRVGPVTQRRIWDEGIGTWDDFLAAENLRAVGPSYKALYDRMLDEHKKRLADGDAKYFAGELHQREHWRFFEVFGSDAAYLDIETTGLAPPYSYTTVVGVYRAGELTQLVAGRDLSGDAVDGLIAGAKLLVTFNGARFDVPFLVGEFGWLRFDMPHLDLCYAGNRVGLKGGLKNVEKVLGLARDEGIEGLDGWAAVQLWKQYERGEGSALEMLLEYNAADVVNMAKLGKVIYDMLVDKELSGR